MICNSYPHLNAKLYNIFKCYKGLCFVHQNSRKLTLQRILYSRIKAIETKISFSKCPLLFLHKGPLDSTIAATITGDGSTRQS